MTINLRVWWDHANNELAEVSTQNELAARLVSLSAALNFEFFSVVFRQSLPGTQIQELALSNYPENWLKRYRERGYSKIDPVLKQGLRTRSLVVWSDNLFARAATLWEEARMAGLSVGMSQCAWSRGGAYAILSLARGTDPLEASAVNELQPYMRLLSDLIASKFQEIVEQMQPRPSHARLTEREIEVLRWSADGKKAFELAMILGVSESTVNFHLHNARRKLGVRNKSQAATYAARLGMFD
ncbi:Regulatory protein SdiA (plasmid) [Burkholderia sp. AD24]|nr:Regulatory protein SdiA [Burkholderia sp. AD24]